jgi:catecholate siderophore receptor
VVTEKLMDDRKIDTVKEALKMTSGVTFLAAEGGEEDIRLRGFPLNTTGDLFIDGMRDPAFYDRDTFNMDRIEVLRGSASMLFGRGSTGGAVNQVNKQAKLLDEPGRRDPRQPPVPPRGGRRQRQDRRRLGAAHQRHAHPGRQQRRRHQPRQVRLRRRLPLGHRQPRRVRGGLLLPENNNGINYGLPYIRKSATRRR